MAVLALDVVGLVAVALGGDIVLLDSTADRLDRRLDTLDLFLGQRRLSVSRPSATSAMADAAMKLLIMDVTSEKPSFVLACSRERARSSR